MARMPTDQAMYDAILDQDLVPTTTVVEELRSRVFERLSRGARFFAAVKDELFAAAPVVEVQVAPGAAAGGWPEGLPERVVEALETLVAERAERTQRLADEADDDDEEEDEEEGQDADARGRDDLALREPDDLALVCTAAEGQVVRLVLAATPDPRLQFRPTRRT